MNATSAAQVILRRPSSRVSLWGRVWPVASRNPQIIFGSIVVLVFVFVGAFAHVLAPYPYDAQNLSNQLRPAIWAGGTPAHLLGTDEFGRDVLSRLIYGARVSLVVGLFSVVLAGVVGVSIGVIGGYVGGTFDALAMRVADVQYAFPYILMAIVISAFWGPGTTSVVAALALAGWMTFARMARASTLSIKQQDYILAARAVGAERGWIMLRHVLPNIMATLLVFATFQVPSRILAEATLSFIGLGIQPPEPSWGNMLAQNRGYLITQPWLVILPGLALSIVALGANQLGDGLRDMLDPRLKNRE